MPTPSRWFNAVALIILFLASAPVQSVERGLQKTSTFYSPTNPAVPFPVRQSPVTPGTWTGPSRAPVADMRILAREKGGALWLGSTNGAARSDPEAKEAWDRWQYFHGKRWLPDNQVLNIHIVESDPRKVWIRTATGVTCIEWRPMTLAEKAELFEERVELRHNRHGLVASSILHSPGDVSSNEMFSSDNDGLWTAIYLGAEAYRYKVTKSPEARARAVRSARALMRLEEITGLKGFPARSFISKTERRPGDGEWHPTPDGNWLWKGDTSSDEIVGHFYGYALFYDLVANREERAEVKQVVARLMDHLIEHDYNLVDVDGKPTRWGEWSESFYKTEEGRYEAPLRSIELFSFLATAWHITGDSKYLRARDDRIARGYADRILEYRRWPGGGEINFSDDELAYLSFHPLLLYEKSPRVRRPALENMRFTWEQIRTDFNPLWNLITAAHRSVPADRQLKSESIATLRRIPLSTIEWDVRNSHRQDVTFRPEKDRFGRTELTRTLPPDERAVHKWNSNPYRPDGGGGGHAEDDGAFFLLPYWMARAEGWLGPRD
jgi:hypothetical protein